MVLKEWEYTPSFFSMSSNFEQVQALLCNPCISSLKLTPVWGSKKEDETLKGETPPTPVEVQGTH